MDEIRKIPPVTRSLLGATGLVTIPCLLAIMTPYKIMLSWPLVTRRYEIYRILTSFFFGGQGLAFLFDSFLLFRNSSDLELSHFARRTADYAWSLIVMGAAILATNYPLQSPVLFSPMLNALTYLWSRTNPDGRVSFFGFITIPAPWLPYAYLFLDLVRGGPSLMIQSGTGIISAHLYWLLAEIWPATNGGRGPRLLETPALLRRLLPDSQDPSMAGQNIGDRQGRRTGAGTAWNAATRGNRLGDGVARQQGPGLWTSIRRSIPSPGWNGLGIWRRPRDTSARAGTGPDREAMLAAAERRLRAQQANSIVGRNLSSSLSSASTAQVPRPQPAGSNADATSSSSVNARASNPSASAAVRRTAAASGQGNVIGFGQLRDSSAKPEDGEEDHSSSGGRVAEKRRKAPTPDSSSEEERRQQQAAQQRHQWGAAGRKLGE
ncbi:uncharacterized protein PFL1_02477 [Pseudozyma flocculosa PF-1]|uniref:Derlin n=2 Tax=Pseudozyma flocculosa TaxID=84751 RepID=A0A5C3EXX1_9BASI|nr:uncharacterized protein PFL1_02477 [Pseudozyma flocculosa PF-1]EPQ29804.1 hypothetical protein PFL1_02477 [Pseudozyma flocculosa PF-1]SPO37094.1 related to DFM1 - ER protein involved in ER-associated protein degradation [Pseudozyma flocculosa]